MMITIEYVLALATEQQIETQQVAAGTQLQEALMLFELDKKTQAMIKNPIYGVFNQIVELDYPLQDGDRIEVYRPLIIDPKQARKIRAERKAKRKS